MTYSTPSARSHKSAIGTYHRNALKLMTMANSKTPRGEEAGYLSAILYLAPHTLAGGKTLCPHSTEACREMCLSGAGLMGLPLQTKARARRARRYLAAPTEFGATLLEDIHKLMMIADEEGMNPVVRLNGTSDIPWELDFAGLFGAYPEVRFMDYTKIPLEHRHPPENYHLTFSHEGSLTVVPALRYLRAGHSVAAVVDEEQKAALMHLGQVAGFGVIDGDAHDLRFLDPPGSIVLLKPKGRIRTSLMRPDLAAELEEANACS